jgi:hypothetical protein
MRFGRAVASGGISGTALVRQRLCFELLLLLLLL